MPKVSQYLDRDGGSLPEKFRLTPDEFKMLANQLSDPEGPLYSISEYAALKALRLAFWRCPDCGFGFDADHHDDQETEEDNRHYTCPLCREVKLEKALKSLLDGFFGAGHRDPRVHEARRVLNEGRANG